MISEIRIKCAQLNSQSGCAHLLQEMQGAVVASLSRGDRAREKNSYACT
jgi:hypothetical protein